MFWVLAISCQQTSHWFLRQWLKIGLLTRVCLQIVKRIEAFDLILMLCIYSTELTLMLYLQLLYAISKCRPHLLKAVLNKSLSFFSDAVAFLDSVSLYILWTPYVYKYYWRERYCGNTKWLFFQEISLCNSGCKCNPSA